jgi:hypothetical protein
VELELLLTNLITANAMSTAAAGWGGTFRSCTPASEITSPPQCPTSPHSFEIFPWMEGNQAAQAERGMKQAWDT